MNNIYLRTRSDYQRPKMYKQQDPMLVYLRNQSPIVLESEVPDKVRRRSKIVPEDEMNDEEDRVIIPPLNTDIRFESELPPHKIF